ncbi:MAG: hypothetical protein KAT65_04455 [Methanophagales archaeon]|nr:hypothetical protein [Methanophagales archaeon]
MGPPVTLCYNDPHITSEEELVNECQFPVRKGRWGRCRRMIGGYFGEKGISSRGIGIRNISYIQPKWENIRNSYIPTNWDIMRSIVDIPSLGDILFMIERREI